MKECSTDVSSAQGDIVVTKPFMKGNEVTISLLAKSLALVPERDVVDKTGYGGLYSIFLQWFLHMMRFCLKLVMEI